MSASTVYMVLCTVEEAKVLMFTSEPLTEKLQVARHSYR